MKSIQTKFIFLMLGCVLISSIVIGGAGIFNSKKAVEEDSSRIMNLLCKEKAQNIDALLSRIEQSVNTVAVYASEHLEDKEKFKIDTNYVNEYTESIKDVAINAANNTEGAVAVYVRFNPQYTEPTSGLFWSKTSMNGNFEELTPTDFSRYSPDDIEHVGWYYIPVKNGKPIWMAPYYNQNIKVRMISYVIPLYVDNETIGVVGMDIDFDVLENIVKGTSVYDTGYAFLADDTGTIMYHKDIEEGTPMANADPSLKLVAEELKNGINSGSYLFPYNFGKEDKKLVFYTLKNSMKFVLTAPTSEIDEAKNRLVSQIVIATLVISIMAVLLTIVMTRKIIRPLKELTVAARKIADGDLSISLSNQTKDEVGTLSDSFQQTVTHLRKYIEYINSLAYRDALTGVKNKTAYQDASQRMEEKMRVGRPEFAVVVLDINGLKKVNDTYGHDFGDMLIIDACKIICKTFRRSPVFRIGGDEFVVILEQNDYDCYRELLDNFHNEMEEYNRTARVDSQVSIAHGIAIFNYETDLVFGNVFKRADEAMYQNKAAMKEGMLKAEENK